MAGRAMPEQISEPRRARENMVGERLTLTPEQTAALRAAKFYYSDLNAMSSIAKIMNLAEIMTAESLRQERAPPQSYVAAREKVKQWLTTVSAERGLDEVVGCEDARAALREAIVEPVRSRELYEAWGVRAPRGVLLSGPPGCGKTMLARSAAGVMAELHGADAELLLVDGPSIQAPYIGVTEQHIRSIFDYAREYHAYWSRPLVVFVDEADAILPDRTGRGGRMPYGYEVSQVSQFLACMDGVRESGAFVMLATNRPEAIDEALLRDGRCDRVVRVSRSDQVAAREILRRSLAGVPLGDTSLDELAELGASMVYSQAAVLREAQVAVHPGEEGSEPEVVSVPFRLAHIVSGALMTGIGARARRLAFARDRDAGAAGPSGLSRDDVMAAVRETLDENRGRRHSFAEAEFAETIPAEVEMRRRPRGLLQ